MIVGRDRQAKPLVSMYDVYDAHDVNKLMVLASTTPGERRGVWVFRAMTYVAVLQISFYICQIIVLH